MHKESGRTSVPNIELRRHFLRKLLSNI